MSVFTIMNIEWESTGERSYGWPFYAEFADGVDKYGNEYEGTAYIVNGEIIDVYNVELLHEGEAIKKKIEKLDKILTKYKRYEKPVQED